MAAGIAAGHHKEGVVLERFSAWLRAHGWTLLVLLFLPLAGMALFPFAHSLLSSGKTPPVAMNDDAQLILFVTGGCGLLLMGFLLLAHSRNRNARLRQESMERSLEYQKLIDLFYRLDVIPLIVPPLRERQGDIRLLVEFFLESYSAARGVRYEISSGLLKKFEAYAWPGNVRELKNFVEYGICFSEDGRLTKKLLEPRFALVGASECSGARVVRRRKPAFDATHLETLLRRYGRSTEGKKAVARQMGISLATLYRHLRRDQEDGAR